MFLLIYFLNVIYISIFDSVFEGYTGLGQAFQQSLFWDMQKNKLSWSPSIVKRDLVPKVPKHREDLKKIL